MTKFTKTRVKFLNKAIKDLEITLDSNVIYPIKVNTAELLNKTSL